MVGNWKIMTFGSVLMGGILVFSLYGIGSTIASGDSDRKWENDEDGFDMRLTVDNALYIEECGSCHIAYPAQMLPAKSWRKIMAGLEDHFDENAELDIESQKTIEEYLATASEYSNGKYRKMFRNLGNQSPLRITQLPYFRHEHDEIPSRFFKDNDKLNSLSQCDACHRNAEKGWFDEDNVFIPGVGRWDD
jgi:hypothetical protein